MADFKSKFMEVYTVLKSELLNDAAFEHTDNSREWVERTLDYHVPKGKLYVGLSVIESYELLKQGNKLTDDEMFLACALGWCLEWLQAYFVAIKNATRGSNSPCNASFTLKLPKTGMLAMNVGLTLHNQKHISRILKKHFKGKPYYADLLDLFNEVEFQTAHGWMMDLVATVAEKDLSQFSLPLHHRIAESRTACFLYYLPVACALLMFGENIENHANIKDILIEMGINFQVQDDYLHCFGDPDETGEIGTDIENFECSWLVVKALEICNEDQKKTLYENYGKDDPMCVAKVKELYKVLKLQDVYSEYVQSSYEKIANSIEAHPRKEVQAVLRSFLAKIKRGKSENTTSREALVV